MKRDIDKGQDLNLCRVVTSETPAGTLVLYFDKGSPAMVTAAWPRLWLLENVRHTGSPGWVASRCAPPPHPERVRAPWYRSQ